MKSGSVYESWRREELRTFKAGAARLTAISRAVTRSLKVPFECPVPRRLIRGGNESRNGLGGPLEATAGWKPVKTEADPPVTARDVERGLTLTASPVRES